MTHKNYPVIGTLLFPFYGCLNLRVLDSGHTVLSGKEDTHDNMIDL